VSCGFGWIKISARREADAFKSRWIEDLMVESLALALFQFFITYGVVDVLVADPGSNINSEIQDLLLGWFVVRLQMSLVWREIIEKSSSSSRCWWAMNVWRISGRSLKSLVLCVGSESGTHGPF
jgi:hypothetical protein